MSRRKLPVESPNWWFLPKALEHRTQQTGANTPTMHDFNQALKAGKLRAMVRRAEGSSEVLPASAWDDLHITELMQVKVNRGGMQSAGLVIRSHKLGAGRSLEQQWFYVWLPDYKNIFGDPHAISSSPAQTQEVPEKRGRKAIHPWPEIGFELISAVRKKGGVAGNKGTSKWAEELTQWCEDHHQKAPADSDLREFIDDVFRVFRIKRK